MSETTAFNQEKTLMEQVMPLVKQLQTICEDNKIPFIAAFSYGVETTEDDTKRHQQFNMGASCYLPGDDTASPEMYLAHKMLFEGMNAAAPYMLAFASKIMSGSTSRTTKKIDEPAAATIN